LSHELNIPAGPYTLADFGTSTHAGDVSIAVRLYVRQLGRIGSDNPVGAAMLYDGAPRIAKPDDPLVHPKPGGYTKKYWEPKSIAFPIYGTDFTKGALGNTVPLPNSYNGTDGKVYSPSGDGVMWGNDPDKGSLHGVHRRILFPDEEATTASVNSTSRPFAGKFSRTFVGNFLSPGTPRSTFMMQSSASDEKRIR
jgi:hypothetical protein